MVEQPVAYRITAFPLGLPAIHSPYLRRGRSFSRLINQLAPSTVDGPIADKSSALRAFLSCAI